MSSLAIVIPAYKSKYFDEALASLAAQTDKNFTVYIGDDFSPEDLTPIIDSYKKKLNIVYKRFENNIGSKNLVLQWKRCVELVKDEEWIWLFSDDDLVDANAVEQFYFILNKDKEKFDVYRFNTCVIDAHAVVTSASPIGPNEESSDEMAYNLLLGLRGNSMPDHIFSRDVYNKNGGFVITDYAQAADWATSILFSKEKGICIIPNSILYWRLSGMNISSISKEDSGKMVLGHFQFIVWLLNHFEYLKSKSDKITFAMMREASVINMKNVIINHYKYLDNRKIPKLLGILRRELGLSIIDSIKIIYSIKRATSSKINSVVDKLKKLKK